MVHCAIIAALPMSENRGGLKDRSSASRTMGRLPTQCRQQHDFLLGRALHHSIDLLGLRLKFQRHNCGSVRLYCQEPGATKKRMTRSKGGQQVLQRPQNLHALADADVVQVEVDEAAHLRRKKCGAVTDRLISVRAAGRNRMERWREERTEKGKKN